MYTDFSRNTFKIFLKNFEIVSCKIAEWAYDKGSARMVVVYFWGYFM